MTATVRIDPDGSTHRLDDRYVLHHARAAWPEIDIVTLQNPVFDPHTFVGIVEDYSYKARPLNMKGWVLYGGTPLYGTVYVGRDDSRPIALDVLSWLDQEWHHLVDERALLQMISIGEHMNIDPTDMNHLTQEASRRGH